MIVVLLERRLFNIFLINQNLISRLFLKQLTFALIGNPCSFNSCSYGMVVFELTIDDTIERLTRQLGWESELDDLIEKVPIDLLQ